MGRRAMGGDVTIIVIGRRAMGGDVMIRGCSAMDGDRTDADADADADWPSPSSASRGSKINNDRNIEVSRLPRPAGDPTPLQGAPLPPGSFQLPASFPVPNQTDASFLADVSLR
jgi:hypothetical protein